MTLIAKTLHIPQAGPIKCTLYLYEKRIFYYYYMRVDDDNDDDDDDDDV